MNEKGGVPDRVRGAPLNVKYMDMGIKFQNRARSSMIREGDDTRERERNQQVQKANQNVQRFSFNSIVRNDAADKAGHNKCIIAENHFSLY